MYCPNCGMQNEDGGKFCVKCGAALPSIQPQEALPAKPQAAGMACHHPGCTEPVVGQCPGYKGSCLRFYCATHSVETYCSVCADKIAQEIAIRAIYEDYLKAAKKVSSATVGRLAWLFPLGAIPMALGALGNEGGDVACYDIFGWRNRCIFGYKVAGQ